MKSISPRSLSCFLSAYRNGLSRRFHPNPLCRLFFAVALPLSCNYLRAAAQSTPHELHIAAAADLQPVLPSLAAAYERETGIHILPTFGSSAILTQQLQNGAPEDLFLSADCSHPQQLIDSHLADDPKPIQYATGVLVLWARKDSPAQPLSLGVLSTSRVLHIAVANDQHAPYGQAATSELRALGLQQILKPKLVTGENIMQTAQFADTGNAQAAFISLTIASSPHFRETGSFIQIPHDYPAIRQCGVTLQSGTNRADAHAFLNWLTTPEVQSRLSNLGLNPAP